jgi:hypothetical protein
LKEFTNFKHWDCYIEVSNLNLSPLFLNLTISVLFLWHTHSSRRGRTGERSAITNRRFDQ